MNLEDSSGNDRPQRRLIGEDADQEFPPRKREALLTGACILLDQLREDLAHLDGGGDVTGTNMIEFLPPGFAHRYSAQFAHQFMACALAVGRKLVQPGFRRPESVGEELALHAVIAQAEAVLVAGGEDSDLEDFREAATEDFDCLLLFERRFDGFEDSLAAESLGTSNLRFEDWFKPFRA